MNFFNLHNYLKFKRVVIYVLLIFDSKVTAKWQYMKQ